MPSFHHMPKDSFLPPGLQLLYWYPEEIEKRKKSGQKKFKIEGVTVKDADGTELSTEYYSKLDDSAILFYTGSYDKEKKFLIEIRCTQRAAVDSEKTNFDEIETNSRGTLIKVCINKPSFFFFIPTNVSGINLQSVSITITSRLYFFFSLPPTIDIVPW